MKIRTPFLLLDDAGQPVEHRTIYDDGSLASTGHLIVVRVGDRLAEGEDVAVKYRVDKVYAREEQT